MVLQKVTKGTKEEVVTDFADVGSLGVALRPLPHGGKAPGFA
jgi:hypothetical protein